MTANERRIISTIDAMRGVVDLLEWHIKRALKEEEAWSAIEEINHRIAVLDAEIIALRQEAK